ncbi:lipase 1-like [Sitodiplosis mosellana]|uniref:lipase 1-like n=1 Tax=Sitodiplosis mosellana TaxID=263140 RepID=UPI00244524A0|nr:lipase 1-like [Sitodiplosis mosellana]
METKGILLIACLAVLLPNAGGNSSKKNSTSMCGNGSKPATSALDKSELFIKKWAEAIGSEESETTKALCSKTTDQLIQYYGYQSEVHHVTTIDGYILTVFRCNSKKAFSGKKKAVILQHGLLSSSDDFTVNIPSQSLSYVLADHGYDVWIPNSRGNFYSKRHEELETSNWQFWDFSWYQLAIHDYPAVIDYVRHETGNSKVFIVAHSQGSTTLMTLLSQLPEYNQYVAAVSLLAPVGYLGNSGTLLQALSKTLPLVMPCRYMELLPRTVAKIATTICSINSLDVSKFVIDVLFGQSENQRNETMMPSFLCHKPSGASTMQLIHFGQEIKYGYFGKYMNDSKVPDNFDLSRINVPMSLHYSPIDTFTNPKDIKRLVHELNHTLAFVQTVESFNHVDFIWGINASPIIYYKILEFFTKY